MRRTFTGFLVIATILGIALIWLGALRPDGFARELLVGIGVALGPAALVTILFRVFLIEDVKREFVGPLTKQVRRTLEDTNTAVRDRTFKELDRYREEMLNLDELREGGIVRCYRNRDDALPDFLNRVQEIEGSMIVVGSSLRGLLPDESCPFAKEIKRRGDNISFVLMHPVVADLRADQERRRHKEIGQEIIDRLRLLSKLGVKANHVYLRRGTPTCFGIMTSELMLLNPYPYLSAAMRSPCFLVSRSRLRDREAYIYETYLENHFDVDQTTSTDKLSDLIKTANELEAALGSYGEILERIVNLSRR
jgi:hypothetical protein